jgi:hypothetical protein
VRDERIVAFQVRLYRNVQKVEYLIPCPACASLRSCLEAFFCSVCSGTRKINFQRFSTWADEVEKRGA